MKVVILAAGTGNRLIHLTRELPKALVEVHGRPLLDYALRFAEELHCREVVVVGGFYFAKLQSYLKQRRKSVRLIENAEYLKGNIFSLLGALPFMDGDFLLMNVDHLYPLRLARLLQEKSAHCNAVTAIVDFDRPLSDDDMKVLLDENRRVSKISKSLGEYDAGYIGMTFVPAASVGHYRRVAERLAGDNENAVVEQVLQQLAQEDPGVDTFAVNGIRWLEVDNLQDLKNAERILKWVPEILD